MKSKALARVEHVLAQQTIFGKSIRTIGLARAYIKIGMMNLAYNIKRLAWINARIATNAHAPVRAPAKQMPRAGFRRHPGDLRGGYQV
jgi:hypothetical protein